MITGTACYLALCFALSSPPTSVPPTSVHLSQIHLSLRSSLPVSPIFGRGMPRGATWAFRCAGLPSSARILHPAAVGPASLCRCGSQRGGWDNLFLQLVSRTHPWTWVWDAFHAGPASGVCSLYDTAWWQGCFEYNYLNALLTWRLFCSSQDGFKNPVPRAFLCAAF